MNTDLKGKNVLITGASRKMGRLTALTFAREGANLAMCSSASMDELEETAKEARALGAKTVTVKCDITDNAQVRAFVGKSHQALGSIDVLVNTAGYREQSPLLEIKTEEWNNCFAVNLTGPLLLCQAVVPHMKEQRWGRIINISGLAFYLGTYAAQAMAKSATVGFTRALAREFGEYNITANCVSPGGGGNRKVLRPDQPIRRQGKPEEFVSLIVYLASEQAGFITGQSYIVGGGAYFQ